MARKPAKPEELMTPAEVGETFRVDARTVTRWAKAGKLTAVWTAGGHRRYRAAEVRALLANGGPGRLSGAAKAAVERGGR
jgi:excisionase family DNA binding protein